MYSAREGQESSRAYDGALYEKDGKVYRFGRGEGAATLLYDFTAQAGDTLMVNAHDTVVVAKVDSVFWNNKPHRHMALFALDKWYRIRGARPDYFGWIDGMGGWGDSPCENISHSHNNFGLTAFSANGRLVYGDGADGNFETSLLRIPFNLQRWTCRCYSKDDPDDFFDYTIFTDADFNVYCANWNNTGDTTATYFFIDGNLAIGDDAEADCTYISDTVRGADHLLYRFGLSVGDEVVCGLDDHPMACVAVDTIVSCYQFYRVEVMRGEDGHEEQWISGVGGDTGPVVPAFVDSAHYTRLLEYSFGDDVQFKGSDLPVPDGIRQPVTHTQAGTAHGLYDLSGRRIGTPRPGQVYIKDGRKRMETR